MLQKMWTRITPWLSPVGLGLLGLACLLGGVWLLKTSGVAWYVKPAPFVMIIAIAALAVEEWRRSPLSAVELKQTQDDLAGLKDELGSLRDTFQQIGGTVPLLPDRIEQLEDTVRKLKDGITRGDLVPGRSVADAVNTVRTALTQTDQALSVRFTDVRRDVHDVSEQLTGLGREMSGLRGDMTDRLVNVSMGIANVIGELRGIVSTRLTEVLEEMKKDAKCGEDLTKQAQELTALLRKLGAAVERLPAFDPNLVTDISQSVTTLKGTGTNLREALARLEAKTEALRAAPPPPAP